MLFRSPSLASDSLLQDLEKTQGLPPCESRLQYAVSASFWRKAEENKVTVNFFLLRKMPERICKPVDGGFSFRSRLSARALAAAMAQVSDSTYLFN